MVKKIPKPDGKFDEVVHNKFYNTFTERMVEDMDDYQANGWNVYYATAGFGAGDKANGDNAVCKKELYLDVDCGEGKPFPDKTAGVTQLRDFVKAIGFPRPTLIDSGNGIHAHWYFKEAVPVHEWKAAAESLKDWCQKYKFPVDGSCTSDTVRVLRVPYTTNFRGNHPTSLLTPVTYHDFSKLRDLLGASDAAAEADMFSKARALSKINSGDRSEVSKLLASNKTSKFEIILKKSVEGTGCAQIKYGFENQSAISEPVWRGLLSNAQYCEDRDYGIHEISKHHPNYTPEETERKASETKGPYTCETFSKLDEGAKCEGCPHRNKITAPIQLGVEFKEAVAEENAVVLNEVKYEISYPPPYFRGKNGGIFMYTKGADGEREAVCVYPHDLYIYGRMRDPQVGDVLCFRHHLPQGDVREFVIPQSEFSSRDKFRDNMNREGVVAYSIAQVISLQGYVGAQIQELQFKKKADDMRTRFGWTTDETFVVGNREYTRNTNLPPTPEGKHHCTVKYSPVAKGLEDLARAFEHRGTLEAWKLAAAQYEGSEYHAHAFGVMAAFGSVLMRISPEDGGMVSWYSKKSGSGKTSIMRVGNSIYGNPKALMKSAEDTKMSKVHRMGVMNGMPVMLDELTNISAEELSDIIYQSTQGRARDRMQGSTNAERPNNITWKLIVQTTSNMSFKDKLSTIKADPQGEMARVMEIYVNTPTPDDVLATQKIFNSLDENFGHAGDVYLRYVVPNMQNIVRPTWNAVRDKIYAMHPWTQTERFALNTVITAVTGGILAGSIDLINYDIKAITQWAVNQVRGATQEAALTTTRAVETFAAFLNRYTNNILIINGATGTPGIPTAYIKEPKASLLARYEPDTATLYVVQKDFNKWCAEQFINAREIRGMFKAETGQELITTKKRLGKGWNSDFGPVNVYEIRNATTVLSLDDGMAASPLKATP